MNHLEILSNTSNAILLFCSVITAVWGVWKIVKEIKKPSNEIKRIISEHDRKLTEDYERLNEIDSYNKIICKSLLVLIDHEITGNSIDRLKSIKTELQDFLIDK